MNDGKSIVRDVIKMTGGDYRMISGAIVALLLKKSKLKDPLIKSDDWGPSNEIILLLRYMGEKLDLEDTMLSRRIGLLITLTHDLFDKEEFLNNTLTFSDGLWLTMFQRMCDEMAIEEDPKSQEFFRLADETLRRRDGVRDTWKKELGDFVLAVQGSSKDHEWFPGDIVYYLDRVVTNEFINLISGEYASDIDDRFIEVLKGAMCFACAIGEAKKIESDLEEGERTLTLSIRKPLGQFIHEERYSKGLNLTKFCELTGMSIKMVAGLERGEIEVDDETLLKIGDALECDIDILHELVRMDASPIMKFPWMNPPIERNPPFGAFLSQQRKLRGWDVSTAATKCGMNEELYSKLESGEWKADPSCLLLIHEAFGMDLGFITEVNEMGRRDDKIWKFAEGEFDGVRFSQLNAWLESLK